MKRTPLKQNPDTYREWQERSRRKQMEAQKNGAQRAKRIKAKRRTRKEFDRIYGSEARRAAIALLPCAVPGCTNRPSENHHLGNGGTGRKADWQNVTPLCLSHHDIYHRSCGSPEVFDERFGTDLRATAARLAVEVPA